MMELQQYQPVDRRLILMDAQRRGFAYQMEVLSNLFYLTIMEAEQSAPTDSMLERGCVRILPRKLSGHDVMAAA
jgi:hypothetical protein